MLKDLQLFALYNLIRGVEKRRDSTAVHSTGADSPA